MDHDDTLAAETATGGDRALPPTNRSARDLDQPGRLPAAIGRYRIDRVLGRGAMGVVLLGHDASLSRDVAIKLLPLEGESPARRARLIREARAMARLAHPNIAVVHEVGEHERDVFIAMERVEGKTLREWATETRRSAAEIIAVYRQAALGLEAAHRVGLVHRDFKPDNAMIGDDGRVRVLDFGLARDVADAANDAVAVTEGQPAREARLTETGAVMGTPAYMPAEQWCGRPADARSDQFSLCVALWEALWARHPFGTESLPALVIAIELGRVVRPKRSGVPRGVEAALRRGLRPAADERHADLTALFAALDRAMRPTRRWRWIRLVLLAVALVLGLGWVTWKLRIEEDMEDFWVAMVLGARTPDELVASADSFMVDQPDAPPTNLAIVRLARARASWLSSCPDPDADGLCLVRRPHGSSPPCQPLVHDRAIVLPRDRARAEAAVVELREAIAATAAIEIDRSSKRGRRLAEALDGASVAVADDALERYVGMGPPVTEISDPQELGTPLWMRWLDDKRRAAAALEQAWHEVSAVTFWSVAVPLRRGIAHQSLADELLTLGLPAEQAARRQTCSALAPIVNDARETARAGFAECIALVERTPDSASLAMTCHEFRDQYEKYDAAAIHELVAE